MKTAEVYRETVYRETKFECPHCGEIVEMDVSGSMEISEMVCMCYHCRNNVLVSD
jgi:transcription elongation factor Elf1